MKSMLSLVCFATLVLVSDIGCAAQATTNAGNSFFDAALKIFTVSDGTVEYVGSSCIYTSTDDGKTWKCMYVHPVGGGDASIETARLIGGGGGSSDKTFCITADAEAVENQRHWMLQTIVDPGKTSAILEIPKPSSVCFDDDFVGGMAAGNSVSFTADGGKTWRPAPPALRERFALRLQKRHFAEYTGLPCKCP